MTASVSVAAAKQRIDDGLRIAVERAGRLKLELPSQLTSSIWIAASLSKAKVKA